MKIHLIRHGITHANIERKYLGISESQLTKEAKIELANLNYTFSDPYVISSPRTRCIDTANIIFGKVDKVVAEFQEINFGDFELHSYDELKDNNLYCSWINNIESSRPPNGEKMSEFKRRVLKKYDEIKKWNQNEIVIVTHGGVIKTIIEEITNKPFFEIDVEFGKFYTVYNKEEINDK